MLSTELLDPPRAATRLLFPVGRYVGTYRTVGGDRVDGTAHQVLFGADVVELAEGHFAVWSMAHGFCERDPRTPWTRNDVTAALASGPLAPAAGRITDELLAAGLLAEVAVGTPDARTFAQRHRLCPLVLGLGNTSEQPDVFVAGFHGHPLAAMTLRLYRVWADAPLVRDLWQGCDEQPAVLDEVLSALHSLLAPSVACLELITR